jgi:hypothetical protein
MASPVIALVIGWLVATVRQQPSNSPSPEEGEHPRSSTKALSAIRSACCFSAVNLT